jgi:hypothetical protein
MAAVGPRVMNLLFGGEGNYARGGLVLIALGMGLYLCGATLNQAALAANRGREASACWAGSAVVFVGILLLPGFDDRVLQVETAFAAAAGLLSVLLFRLYRRG